MNNIVKPNNLKKLSLYARSKGNPDAIQWRILGACVDHAIIESTLTRFDFVHDITQISSIGIEVIDRVDHQSAVIVELIELAGEPLRDLDHFGVYRLKRGGIKRSYGYLDEPGAYQFKIRYNAVVHNFVLFSMSEVTYDN